MEKVKAITDRLTFRISTPASTPKEAATRTVEAPQHLLEQSSSEDLEAVSSRIERALESPDVLEERCRTLVADLSGGREYGRHERSALQMVNSGLIRRGLCKNLDMAFRERLPSTHSGE